MSDLDKAAKFANWFRTGSALLAGLKISGAFMTWVSTGVVAEWFIERFYPYTRLLWGDLFDWVGWPDLSDVQKDALTALVFFLPLGFSSLWTLMRGKTDNEYYQSRDYQVDRRVGLAFGLAFFLIMCGGVMANIVSLYV